MATQYTPCSFLSADEELRAIGSWSSIGHGQDARSSVPEGEVLILKLVAVDGLSTSSVVVGEVTALRAHERVSDGQNENTSQPQASSSADARRQRAFQSCYLAHEAWDDAVETGALVAEALLASAQGAEVLSRLGRDVGPQLWKH